MTLFTDIDGTLIFSRKNDLGVCVEKYKGEDFSFTTKGCIDCLGKLNENDVIYITTRSKEQFDRLNLPQFKYTLIANGGVLLRNGIIDKDYYLESLNMIEKCRDTLEKAVNFLNKYCSDVRFVNNLFVFAKNDDVNFIYDGLNDILDLSLIIVYRKGKKIYVIPKVLTKGYAIRRLKERLDLGYIIGAGDSEMDRSMISEVDKYYENKGDYNFGEFLFDHLCQKVR